jgi:hypothetical protein
MDAMMRSWAEGQGKRRWGEKTPRHVFYWREILDCFPDARLIHLVRDGRDVADSYMKARFGPKTTYMAARQWVAWLKQVEAVRQVVPARQFIEVRYEDILAEPESELTRICEYLGESFSARMLEFHKTALSDNVTDVSNRTNLRSPLLSGNTQKWRKEYSQGRLRTFESIARPMLIRHGYETAFASRPRLAAYRRFYHRAIEHPARRGPAMFKNRIGYVEAWSLLKIRLRLKWVDSFRES